MNQYIQSNVFDDNIYNLYSEYISQVYPNFLRKIGLNNVAVKAEGAIIIDSSGKEYIDCIGGYGLFNLGHNHPIVIQSLIEQLQERQLFTKPLITEISTVLARKLTEITPGDLSCSFICNSGSEAIDSAIKLARMATRKKTIISAKNSFHGYTFGALSVSGIPSFKKLFEPLLPDIINIPFGDAKVLKEQITEDTAAVLLEPIQHEAGIVMPSEGYFRDVRRICDEKNTLLIIDEIKTGIGKTGFMFASEHFDVVPDILVTGKSLGGGLIPIGALVAKKSLWKKFSFSFSMSASSYAGNTLACRAAITTINLLQRGSYLTDCKTKGSYLIEELQKIAQHHHKIIKKVSGLGLLIGVETISPSTTFQISGALIRQGVLAVPAFANSSTLMIEPPLVISDEQVAKIIKSLDNACQ